MTFYHGSPIGDLRELEPFLSEHGFPYVYFSTHPLVALLYAVKPVPKPFSFYPYGFDQNGVVIYSEYFENAFCRLYQGRIGYLYECDDLKNLETPTQINSVYTGTGPVKIDRVTKIPDLYVFYKEQEQKGRFKIKKKSEISQREMQFVFEELRKELQKNELKRFPDHPMSLFIQTYFPTAWEEVTEYDKRKGAD